MIEVKNLTKKYGNNTAVDNISFTVNKGEIVGLLGPNGAGKTTTIRMLTGYLTPTAGSAKVVNFDIIKDSLNVRKRLGYLSENSPLYEDMNVSEYLALSCELHNIDKKDRDQRLAKVIQLCGLRGREIQDIKELSKGFRQRVGLAQSLIHDPEVLILDEPTTGLDPNQRIEIRELIKNIGKQKTVILSSHILSEVEATCDRVLIINKGKIVASGTPEELSSDAPRIYVKIRGSNKSHMDKVLRDFSEIKQIVESSLTDDVFFATMEVSGNADCRNSLIRYLLKNDLELLEIFKKERSLEDIFVQLTK